MLALGGAHAAGFAIVRGEAFVEEDGSDVVGEVVGETGAGEGEIVGVAGVLEMQGVGEAGEAAIEFEGDGVGEGRGGGGALGEGAAVAAQAGESIGHRFGVVGGTEEGGDAGFGDRREEVGEVEAEDGGLGDVGGDEGEDGAAGAEAVGGGMEGEMVENAREELALDGFEAGLGGGEVAEAAGGLGLGEAVVVGRVGVGEPGELGGGDGEVGGEFREGGQRGDGPGKRGDHLGRGGEVLGDGEGADVLENGVVAEEIDEGAVAGAGLGGEGLGDAREEGGEPGVIAAEGVAGAGGQGFEGDGASEERVGEGGEGGVGDDVWHGEATEGSNVSCWAGSCLREAQWGSREGVAGLGEAPGVTPEDPGVALGALRWT